MNEQIGSRIKRVRKAEPSAVYDVQLVWFKQHRSAKVPFSDPLYMITFVLHKYQSYVNVFQHKPVWKIRNIEKHILLSVNYNSNLGERGGTFVEALQFTMGYLEFYIDIKLPVTRGFCS